MRGARGMWRTPRRGPRPRHDRQGPWSMTVPRRRGRKGGQSQGCRAHRKGSTRGIQGNDPRRSWRKVSGNAQRTRRCGSRLPRNRRKQTWCSRSEQNPRNEGTGCPPRNAEWEKGGKGRREGMEDGYFPCSAPEAGGCAVGGLSWTVPVSENRMSGQPSGSTTLTEKSTLTLSCPLRGVMTAVSWNLPSCLSSRMSAPGGSAGWTSSRDILSPGSEGTSSWRNSCMPPALRTPRHRLGAGETSSKGIARPSAMILMKRRPGLSVST